jgi:MFS family permease
MNEPAGHPRRWLALAVLCLALAMIVIDNTILAVAIPSIARELHASESDLQWIGTSYGLVLAGLLLPVAVLGDRHGRKGLMLIGLAIFGAASGAASLSNTPAQLAVARGVMGVGGACTMPATLSVLGNVFSEQERPRAIAIWSGVAGLGSAVGPILGGLLLARFWWGSVFLVNVPLAAVAIVAAAVLVPTSRDPSRRPLDAQNALCWWGALTATLIAIIEGPVRGWLSPTVLIAVIAAVVLGFEFLRRERTSRGPLIPRDSARDPRLRWGAATMASLFFAAFGTQFILTQWLQGPKKLSALGAGIYFVPMAAAGFVASLRNPRLVARFAHGAVAATGLVSMAAGALSAAIAVGRDNFAGVVVGAVLVGWGIGQTAASGAEVIMSSAPPEQAGAAAGVNETIVEAGGALGIAVVGSVLAGTHSFGWPLVVCAGVALVAAIAVSRALRPARLTPVPPTSDRSPRSPTP